MKNNIVINAIDFCEKFKRKTTELTEDGTRYYIDENGIGTIMTGVFNTSISVITNENKKFTIDVKNVLDVKNAKKIVDCYFHGCANVINTI